MDILQRFLAYAGDFERTLADDDWSRLRRYFADDAVYHVQSDSFGCTLVGPTAIFAGIKRSLDNFDRKFSKRDIDVTSGPEIEADEMRIGWDVLYSKDGLPNFILRGRSIVRFAGDVIVYLSDIYDPSVTVALADWRRQTGIAIDPAYV